MNFKNYEIYDNDTYKSINNKRRELSKSLTRFHVTLKNADKVILDSLELSQEEYEKSGAKYSSYSVSRITDRNIQDQLKKLDIELGNFILDFKLNVRNNFFNDCSSELSISTAAVISLTKVIINRSFFIYKNFIPDYEEDSVDFNFFTFNDFMSESFGIDSNFLENLFSLISDEVEVLRIKL